jgi:ribonuclease-3
MTVVRMFLLSKPHPLRDLERSIGYRFKDRALLQEALTHPSYCAEHGASGRHNQRLEYLGDAVLGLLAAQHVFGRHADADEGRLTALRSQVASGRALAAVARSIGLGAYLRLGKGEERAGGRERGGMLADSMEAVFGAAWVDGGLRASSKLFTKLVAARLESLPADGGSDNPKGDLQEKTQRELRCAPVYERLTIEGPAHAPVYRVRVSIPGYTATAAGSTRRLAEAAAARELLQQWRAAEASRPLSG